jgi:hypothetical protein
MKLRIQENSLRLRLTQKEVAQLRERGRVESSVEFSPGQELVYLLEGSFHAKSLSVAFNGRFSRVTVPTDVMTEWVESDQVGIDAPSQAGLQLLIEKDFQCLHSRGEQDRDAYSHPLMS